jgi:hypothetical protein
MNSPRNSIIARESTPKKRELNWPIVTVVLVILICKCHSIIKCFVSFFTAMKGICFVVGNLYIDHKENSTVQLQLWMTRISPSNPSWWFYAIDSWPTCDDKRAQVWRLISLQFVHGEQQFATFSFKLRFNFLIYK